MSISGDASDVKFNIMDSAAKANNTPVQAVMNSAGKTASKIIESGGDLLTAPVVWLKDMQQNWVMYMVVLSKLRIVSYDKRRSLKGNVYYVRFASDADIAFADRICKRLQNVTMKPFQSRSTTVTSNPVIKSTTAISKSNSLRSDNKTSKESSIQVLDTTDTITSLTSNVPISNV
ncbi:unnamed protein product, partial [Adineta ricciae]